MAPVRSAASPLSVKAPLIASKPWLMRLCGQSSLRAIR
ncbi:Uncharacterised protein [Bordetella pertussis]|nr:Uncharacterised protein [Bordetella pertussis]